MNSTLEQDDAGITQDFDFAAFDDGAYGYLPNDRRHTVKLFGAYDITDQWRVGGNMLVQSGRPVNCNGFIPEDHPSNQSIDFGSISAVLGLELLVPRRRRCPEPGQPWRPRPYALVDDVRCERCLDPDLRATAS